MEADGMQLGSAAAVLIARCASLVFAVIAKLWRILVWSRGVRNAGVFGVLGVAELPVPIRSAGRRAPPCSPAGTD